MFEFIGLLMSTAGHGCAIENVWGGSPIHDQVSGESALHACQGVIDQYVPARHFQLELYDGRVTRRDARRLNARSRWGG